MACAISLRSIQNSNVGVRITKSQISNVFLMETLKYRLFAVIGLHVPDKYFQKIPKPLLNRIKMVYGQFLCDGNFRNPEWVDDMRVMVDLLIYRTANRGGAKPDRICITYISPIKPYVWWSGVHRMGPILVGNTSESVHLIRNYCILADLARKWARKRRWKYGQNG